MRGKGANYFAFTAAPGRRDRTNQFMENASKGSLVQRELSKIPGFLTERLKLLFYGISSTGVKDSKYRYSGIRLL